MSNTLVIQSHRVPLPYPWLSSCLDSVRYWSELNKYDYRFLSDELYDYLPEEIRDKMATQKVIASDLARLLALQDALNNGYEMVVWLDADFLIFNPENFALPQTPYAVGREIWVQHDNQRRLKVYKKVHNAFLMFRLENNFLDFYCETAERLWRKNQGSMPPQFIGPKLLTALHNIAQLPVLETAAMLSPLVIKDIVSGGGEALTCFIEHSAQSIAGANLCISSCERNDVTCNEMDQLIGLLKTKRGLL